MYPINLVLFCAGLESIDRASKKYVYEWLTTLALQKQHNHAQCKQSNVVGYAVG
jgi:hypothetical protein